MTKKKPVEAKLKLTDASVGYLEAIASGFLVSVDPDQATSLAREIAEQDALNEEVDVNGALHGILGAIANIQKQLDALNFVIADAAGVIQKAVEELADES